MVKKGCQDPDMINPRFSKPYSLLGEMMMFKRFLFVIAKVTAIVSAYYAIFFVQEFF